MATPLYTFHKEFFNSLEKEYPQFKNGFSLCRRLPNEALPFLKGTLKEISKLGNLAELDSHTFRYHKKVKSPYRFAFLCRQNQLYIFFDFFSKGSIKKVSHAVEMISGDVFARIKVKKIDIKMDLADTVNAVKVEEAILNSLDSPFVEKKSFFQFDSLRKYEFLKFMGVKHRERLNLLRECYNTDLYYLMDETKGERAPPLLDRVQIFFDVCKGVVYLESQSLAHSDLKPDNIFLKRSQDSVTHAVLGDLGLAVKYNTPTPVGTLLWAAPELKARIDRLGTSKLMMEIVAANVAIDMWGLGAILLFLFTDYEIVGTSMAECCTSQQAIEHYLARLKVSSKTYYKNSDVEKVLLELAEELLKYDPKERPTIECLDCKIEEILALAKKTVS